MGSSLSTFVTSPFLSQSPLPPPERLYDLFTATSAYEVKMCTFLGDNLEEEREGQTPLFSSISSGNKEVFLSLLQHGAKPNNFSSSFDVKPILWTASLGWNEEVYNLAKAGADVNENISGHGTALHLAAERGSLALVETLLFFKADTEIRDEAGNTALMKACEKGHVEIVDRLLASGTNINLQDNEGRTALMWAVSCPLKKIPRNLQALGCQINLMSANDLTSSQLEEKKRVEVVKILLAHGADTQIKDNQGKKAIDLTRSQEFKDLLQW